jgi:hypothetical protein
MAKTEKNMDDNTMIEMVEERIHRIEGIIINLTQDNEETSEDDEVKSVDSVPDFTKNDQHLSGSESVQI